MKSFYSYIDQLAGVPQPIQHLAIREMAARASGAVTFYGSEEIKTTYSQSFILEKLRRTPGFDGVIFFSLNQFRYGSSFNFGVLRSVLTLVPEVHFARESVSINGLSGLDESFAILFATDYTKRIVSNPQWRKFVSEADSEE
jgi:hypothetical protein